MFQDEVIDVSSIDNITNNEIPKTFQYIHIFILKKEIKINF